MSRFFSDEETKLKNYNYIADYYTGKLAVVYQDRQINSNPTRYDTSDVLESLTMGSTSVEDASKKFESKGVINYQRLIELPHALLYSKRFRELVDFITNVDVIETSFEAGCLYCYY